MTIYFKVTVSNDTVNQVLDFFQQISKGKLNLPPEGEIINLNIDDFLSNAGIDLNQLLPIAADIAHRLKNQSVTESDYNGYFVKRTDCTPEQFLKSDGNDYIMADGPTMAAIFSEEIAIAQVAFLRERYPQHSFEYIHIADQLNLQ